MLKALTDNESAIRALQTAVSVLVDIVPNQPRDDDYC